MTDADRLALLDEYQSLVERAATKERDAALLNTQATTKYNEARALKDRAKVIAVQLGITVC